MNPNHTSIEIIPGSIFITGTDTNVGKTTITAALLSRLQQEGQSIGILKPIETGVDTGSPQHSDTERLRQLLSPSPSFASVCLYAFPEPLAPLVAARHSGTLIDPSRISSHVKALLQRYSYVFIEGAGGVFTPIAPQYTIRDLIALLNASCVIVGRTGIGGVNHCQLTVHALQQIQIPILGIVLNQHHPPTLSSTTQQQEESTVELIREWSPVPVFGPIAYSDSIGTNWLEGVIQLSNNPEIRRLLTHLCQKRKETE